jgi:nucleotide-binding universal stress UspA family protein
METIVVGLDGSNGARAAARWAASQAQAHDARIVAVHSVPRSELWSLSAVQVDIDAVLAELRGLLDGRWSAPLRTVAHTTQQVRGEPATQLLRVADRSGASMIVLGAKSHNAVADLVVGGTVHKVINRSTIPVVLVPTPTTPKRRPSTRTRARK